MTTHVQRRDDANGQGLSDLVQVRRASGEILQLPAADCYSPTSFAMLLDNWHQFEARHDDVWLFGYPRSGQGDENCRYMTLCFMWALSLVSYQKVQLIRDVGLAACIRNHYSANVSYDTRNKQTSARFVVWRFRLLLYSSFIVHQHCMCFNGALMHNK